MQNYSKYVLLVLVVLVFVLGGSTSFTSDTPSIIMVDIPGGTFEMGCSPNDGECGSDEFPRHTVTISPFRMSAYEITQAQWEAVVGYNPSHFRDCPNCPVENMYWNDIQDFITKLNQLTGLQFRLPTEAEWEYAARAGTTTKYYCGDNESCLGNIAWYEANSGERTQPVGQKVPNAWGLYDMIGNVWERCQDWYDPNYYSVSPSLDPRGPASGLNHVRRGGSWTWHATVCRSSQRYISGNPIHGYDLGFRVCLPYSTNTTSTVPITSSIPTTSTIPITTTTTIGNGCPPGSPIDCGNGWCCSWDYPICGYGIDAGKCFTDSGNGGELCYLKMLYGEHSQEVQLLRFFRDNVLNKTQEGQELIKLYYQWSPVIVRAMEVDDEFKEDVKEMIDEILPLIEGKVE